MYRTIYNRPLHSPSPQKDTAKLIDNWWWEFSEVFGKIKWTYPSNPLFWIPFTAILSLCMILTVFFSHLKEISNPDTLCLGNMKWVKMHFKMYRGSHFVSNFCLASHKAQSSHSLTTRQFIIVKNSPSHCSSSNDGKMKICGVLIDVTHHYYIIAMKLTSFYIVLYWKCKQLRASLV